MNRRFRRRSSGAFTITVGWLFADLLLALGVLFLISSPPGPRLVPTPTPTLVVIPPTPTPNTRILEHNYCRIKLNIGSPDAFINAKASAARPIVEQQLNQLAFLRARKVGLALAYGGTIGGSEDQGAAIAAQVYNVLKVLARDPNAYTNAIFGTASLYEPLFTGLETSSTAILNVYLIVRQDNPGETCNAQHIVK